MSGQTSQEVPVAKLSKITFFALLLIASGYFLGAVSRSFGQVYTFFFQPGREILELGLWFLLAVGAVAVTAGLVAALIRPLWVAAVAFALSALALLFGWEVGVGPAILALLYFVASLLYARGVSKELQQRLSFSVEPLTRGFALLFMVLAIVACGSLYMGYAAQVEREGFNFPPAFQDVMVRMTMTPMRGAIEAQTDLTPQQKEAALKEMEEGFEEMWMEPLEEMIKPYERLIPVAVAIGLFMTLQTILGLLSWIPGLILAIAFPILRVTGMTQVVTEMREVERLTL